MARCNDCNKFVPYDDGEAEADLDVDDSSISGSVRLTKGCGECGSELKSADFDVDVDFDLPSEWLNEDGDLKDGYDLEVDCGDPETTERSDGKPNTPSRYCRTFYGFTMTVAVTCNDEDGDPVPFKDKDGVERTELEVEISDEVQASGMDDSQ